MTITATRICDSMSNQGIRLTTLQLRYPRFIHAELMTHRVFSRNASSSRAVPVAKLIEDIKRDTAMPIHWGKNQPGMQADEEHDAPIIVQDSISSFSYTREEAWRRARNKAISAAEDFNAAGYHKQIVNRLLEPFSHINVVVTATEWKNFFDLRRHKDAQPEIKALADAIWDEMYGPGWFEKYKIVKRDEWHLPYITEEEEADPMIKDPGCTYLGDLRKCSVARCARVSYMTYEMKKPSLEEDLKLYERLVGSNPKHMSPTEHQATPDNWARGISSAKTFGGDYEWASPIYHGNFRGWKQFRKLIEV